MTSTYNAATGVWTASGAIANVNTLLAGLTLTPAANFNGSFSIATSISDGVAPAITGSKAFTGTAVNDAPVISSNGGSDTASVSVAENSTAVTTVVASDPDAGATLSYSIVGGADAAKFVINSATGALSFITAPNFFAPTDAGGNNVYDVTVQASDGFGGTDSQAIAVAVVKSNNVVQWTSSVTGNSKFPGNWSTNSLPGPQDVALLNLPVVVSHTTGSDTVGGLYVSAGVLLLSGGALIVNGTSAINSLVETGGTLTLNGTSSIGTLTQSSGQLNGSGALTATGASSFSGGTQSGSGTTIATGGAAFSLTGFGLDGGRTLQLGGASTATGTFVQISLNAANPNTGVSDAGSGILTIASGATFTDQTTSSGLTITAPSQGGTDTGGDVGGEQRRHLHQVGQRFDLDNLRAVQQHRHGERAERHAEPVRRRYRHRCNLPGSRYGQLQRWHPDAGHYLSH